MLYCSMQNTSKDTAAQTNSTELFLGDFGSFTILTLMKMSKCEHSQFFLIIFASKYKSCNSLKILECHLSQEASSDQRQDLLCDQKMENYLQHCLKDIPQIFIQKLPSEVTGTGNITLLYLGKRFGAQIKTSDFHLHNHLQLTTQKTAVYSTQNKRENVRQDFSEKRCPGTFFYLYASCFLLHCQ